MLKKLFTIGIVLLISSATNAQNYKEWDSHDVVRFYEKKQITLQAFGVPCIVISSFLNSCKKTFQNHQNIRSRFGLSILAFIDMFKFLQIPREMKDSALLTSRASVQQVYPSGDSYYKF